MLEKLKQNDRIEFMLKENRINDVYTKQRLIGFMFGFTGVILLSLDSVLASIFCFIIFIINLVLDKKVLIKSKAKLLSEYFDIKPKEKTK